MDLPTAIEKYWSHAIALAAAIGGVIKWWADARAKRRDALAAERAAEASAKIDLAKLAQEAAGEVVQLLREEIARLAGELDDVRASMREMQREHLTMMADKDAKIAQLEGDLRQRDALLEIYRRYMVEQGVVPPLALGHFEVIGDPPTVKPAAEEAL